MGTSALNGRQLERVRYFSRQLMTAEDMTAEQNYFRQKLRRHARYLHGWGVVCGCRVESVNASSHPWRVRVCPGYVVTPQGDEILIGAAVEVDVATALTRAEEPCTPQPCPPTAITGTSAESASVYVAVCYQECPARPVRVHPTGCGCDQADCEYSRIRDGFDIRILRDLPSSHEGSEIDEQWCSAVRAWFTSGKGDSLFGAPVPDCPECPESPCVVLATLRLPNRATDPITTITTESRRPLYSTTHLHQMAHCLR